MTDPMTEKDVLELIGHMVVQMRRAEMEIARQSEQIAALQKETLELKGETSSKG